VKRETRDSLSALAATLLACGGAALIATAPDWVSRMGLSRSALTGADAAVGQHLARVAHVLRDRYAWPAGTGASPTRVGSAEDERVAVDGTVPETAQTVR
jgi:hypothetical protein